MGCAWSRPAKRSKQYQLPDEAPHGSPGPQDSKHAHTAGTAPVVASSVQHSPSRQQAAACHHGTAPTAAGKKAKLDPKDFMFTGLQSETRVKLPGSVQGQQFIIDNCKDCNLFVPDHCASVTIDDCSNCRVFIGPTEASVFVRDCSNCTLACITRQLRCRGCHSCKLLLHCRTRPIIESSSGMAFGCYCAPYAGLAGQMAAAGLSPFHNLWSDVYDFTPVKATAGQPVQLGQPAAAPAAAGEAAEQCNWSLLPDAVSLQQLLGDPDLPSDVLPLMGLHAAAAAAAGGMAAGAGDAIVAAGPTAGPAAAAEGPLPSSAAVPALTDADAMCAMYTQGLRQCDASRPAGPSRTSANSSSSSSQGQPLFVLFPAGQRAAALHWVFKHVAGLQQQQQQLPAEKPVAAQPASGDSNATETSSPCAAAASAAAAGSLGLTADSVSIDTGSSAGDSSSSSPGASCIAAGTTPADAAAALPVLLHTNEASIPAAVSQQLSTAAGWSKAQLKQLVAAAAAAGRGAQKAPGAGACVGLEVSCSSEAARQQLQLSAEGAGALCCTSAAHVFRDLGMDG